MTKYECSSKEKNIQDVRLIEKFLNLTQNGISIELKIDKMDLIKVRNLCSIKKAWLYKAIVLSCREEKTANYKLGENIHKPHIWKRVCI